MIKVVGIITSLTYRVVNYCTRAVQPCNNILVDFFQFIKINSVAAGQDSVTIDLEKLKEKEPESRLSKSASIKFSDTILMSARE